MQCIIGNTFKWKDRGIGDTNLQQEMARSLSIPCCRVEDLAGTTLVTKILAIQGHAMSNIKSVQWAATFECLSRISGRNNFLELESEPSEGGDHNKYVSVSYSWQHTPNLESDHSRGYIILDRRRGLVRHNETRNIVLDRVLRYIEYRDIPRFWIDRECVAQIQAEEHQTALDSMDLVHSRSMYPLGLLATVLETQNEVNLLKRLLKGAFVNRRLGDGFSILE